MCFSESVSFTVSALLVSAGIYCVKTALDKDRTCLPLAGLPLAFGLQQGFEGVVWWGINTRNPEAASLSAFAFLFFSHWFWLGWIPFLVLRLESNSGTRAICKGLVVVGIGYGALLYVPLALNPAGLSVGVIEHSIEYQATFIGDSIPILFSRLLYALIILIPLLIATSPHLKIFGGLITLSTGASYFLYNYAFVSVWCFFAALLSLYIVYVISTMNATSEILLEEQMS
ncbi:MAG: hypothetical protein HC881_08945 [Leptolyngbyaceae cyanobacterium SL_7_1]|nr:hypothetical protein [Leptolyngbyaceae cyanobacterium SL_7_1]